MAQRWPVEIVTDEAVACGAVVVQHRGRRGLTVVVKVSFSLVHGGPMLAGAPAPVAREDRPFEGSPARSLEAASDLAPFLPRCDVLFRGHAYAQKGQAAPAGAARLALFRDARPLIDKTIHVFAQGAAGRDARQALPRAVQASAAAGADQLFSRMPIVYERAFGGPDVEANPAGTKTPNLVDPADPRRPAGFGPIAPHWAPRRRLFGTRRPDPESLPDDLEWGYFQAAPPDQQIEHLRGGEWLVLDGLHPVLARLQTQIPAARGAARVLSRGSGAVRGSGPKEVIDLVADTLSIDGEAHQCTITWRGQVPITGAGEGLSGVVVMAGLEVPERPVQWARLAAQAVSRMQANAPAVAAPGPASPQASPAARAPGPVAALPEEAPRSLRHQTVTFSAPQQGAAAASAPLPFSGPPSVRSPARDRQSQPRTDATPWGPPSVRSMPVVEPASPKVTIATPIPVAPPPVSGLPFVPSAAPAPAAARSAVSPPPEPPDTPPWVRDEDERPPPEPIAVEPPAPPIAVSPPPLVGPIQAPVTPAQATVSPAIESAAAAPKPAVPAPPALPKSLGKGNLGADQVASFLKAFELPPAGGKG